MIEGAERRHQKTHRAHSTQPAKPVRRPCQAASLGPFSATCRSRPFAPQRCSPTRNGRYRQAYQDAATTISGQMTAMGVRREKAALSSGCKTHPATAPAGSNRSSYGGDEIAEAVGMRATNWWQRECAGRNASERRASLEKDDAQADPTTLSGKADMAGITSEINHPAAAPG